MAKEKEPVAHQLYKQVPGSTLTVFDSVGDTTATNSWKPLNTFDMCYRTYIDLTGWSQQELTTFIQGVDIQKADIPILAPPPATADIVWEYDFLTTRRLTDRELGFISFGDTPGFFPSTLDLMELIYGERMQYARNTQIPQTVIQVSGETFGSGNPTAMSRLHWTRYIRLGNSLPSDSVSIHATNLVVQALSVEEKDLVWMERLRRSYVLQEQADVEV